MKLEDIKDELLKYNLYDNVSIEGGELIIGSHYDLSYNAKNDDDCCDNAREIGESVIEQFPILEISEYTCNKWVYSIVCLRIKSSN